MIANHDRSGWFGASDTNIIMGNWHTKTFAKWWLEKLGVVRNQYTNLYMIAGSHYEHRVLDAIGVAQKDRQIRIRRLRLRVNLDGETRGTIKEVKTYSGQKFKVSTGYWRQAQVQMFATKKKLDIVAYKMEPEDFKNFYRPIELSRISVHSIAYDQKFIENEYLPRLLYLKKCLAKRQTPDPERKSILGSD